MTFWLRGTHSDAPAGFAPVAGGAGWHVTHDQLNRSDLAAPYVPIVFPVGDDEEGTWLVALGPGHVLPLLGTEADALERSVRAAAGAWAWADTLVRHRRRHRSRNCCPRRRPTHGSRGTCCSSETPARLPPLVAARTAIVTTANVGASDLTILVDRHGATIHPLSRVVRPHLQSEDAARNIAELVAPALVTDPRSGTRAALTRVPSTGPTRPAPQRSSRVRSTSAC